MPKESEKQRIFSRRAMIFGGVQVAVFSLLVGRLFYLQFVKSGEYKTLSENNRIKLQLLTPERGLLLDRKGKILATSKKNYRLYIDFSTLDKEGFEESVKKLNDLMQLPEKSLEMLQKAKLSTSARPKLLKEHLSWEEVSLIELNRLSLNGVYIDIGQLRHYPLSKKASHLLGYVGAVSAKELSKDDQPLMRLPDFKIGKNGIEKTLEERLRGSAGIRQLEVNVHGVPVREIGNKESIAGESIRLTIDKDLQEYSANRVKDESAAIVVMEVDTGNVLALVSMPGFDPNSFSRGISNKEWAELNKNKKSPLMNKAITGQYPPGSTFKMIVGMAALEAKIVTPSSTVYCPGHFMLNDHRFNCWKQEGHGHMNFHDAITQSCDTYFYTVAQKLGIERINNMARRFGLGELHNIKLIGEKKGIIPNPDWKMKRYGRRWSGGDTINASIGQGYVLSTPLQLAVMMSRMASGRKVEPRLWVDSGAPPAIFEPMDVAQSLLLRNRAAMSSVVNFPKGTAYGKRINEPRFAFGGKTGTSQVRRITQRGMDQSLLPWKYRHHALFVGFAPIDKPKYAISVIIEHGGGGSSAAAPVARDILLKLQQIEEQGE